MKRIARDAQDDQNYDSFLDIVANLVGILVILIMVIGVRAREASQSQVAAEPSTSSAQTLIIPMPEETGPVVSLNQHRAVEEQIAQLSDSMQTAKSNSISANRDVQEIDARIKDIERRAYVEEEERNRLQLLVSMSEKSLEERRKKLAQDQQTDLATSQQVDESRVELASLEQQIAAIEANTGDTKILEHHPTPIAKTVFGAEDHLQLMDGRVAYVPINEMTAMLRRDAENKMWKLGNTSQVTELIGPIDGFRMKYTLERRQKRVMTPDGARLRKIVELKRFVMVPESPELGEPISVAILAGSQLEHRLAVINPSETTITVWTYPDSFASFRELKSYLNAKGYIVAARPLPEGYPIGGSPDGTKSAAE